MKGNKISIVLHHITGLSSVGGDGTYEKCFLKFENDKKSQIYKFRFQIELHIKLDRSYRLDSDNNFEIITLFAEKFKSKQYEEIGSAKLSYFPSNDFFIMSVDHKNVRIASMLVEYENRPKIEISNNFIGNLQQFHERDFSKKKEKLGSGGYSAVFRVFHNPSKKYFAFKEFYTKVMIHSHEFRREALLSQIIDHPTIVRCEGFVLDSNSRFISGLVFEYVDGFTLEELFNMEKNDIQPEWWGSTQKTKVLYGISVGLSLLHAHGIVHRDLKPSNIIVDRNIEPHICDFGVSRALEESYELTQDVGTDFYQSPEQKNGGSEYDYPVDIFALGQIIFELSSSRQRNTGDRDDFKWISSNLRVIVHTMLNENPSKRPRISEIVFMIEHEALFIFGTDHEEVRAYVSRMRGFPAELSSVMRNDFIHDRLKASSGDDDSLSSVSVQSLIFGDSCLSSELNHLRFLIGGDILSEIIEYFLQRDVMCVASNIESELIIDSLFETNSDPENYRFGLLDLRDTAKNKLTVFIEAMQVINGLRPPDIFLDDERKTKHLRTSVEIRALIRLYHLFTYHSFIGGNSAMALAGIYYKEKGNPYYDIEKGSYYVREAHLSFNTYAMILYSGNAITQQYTDYIEQYGEIIASHNVGFIIECFAFHYDFIRHYHKAAHYAAKGVCFGSEACRNIFESHQSLVERKFHKTLRDNCLASYLLIHLHKCYEEDLTEVVYEIFDDELSTEYLTELKESNPGLYNEIVYGFFTKIDIERGNLSDVYNYSGYLLSTKRDSTSLKQAESLLLKGFNLGIIEYYQIGGLFYLNGYTQKGIEYFHKGSERGEANASYLLCLFYNQTKDHGLLEKLKQQSKESALWAISRGRKLFNDGKYDEALPYLEKGLELKSEKALAYLCDIHLNKGDYQKAYEYAIQMSDKTLVGYFYMTGIVVEKNLQLAEKFFVDGAAKGNIRAHFHLGCLYEETNYDKALQHHLYAAENGGLNSINFVSRHFLKVRDFKESYRYAMISANYGSKYAQEILGKIFLIGGHGVKRDFSKSAYYFQLAANQGMPVSQEIFGIMLIEGKGVKVDKESGFRYLTAAANNGNSYAIKYLRDHELLR